MKLRNVVPMLCVFAMIFAGYNSNAAIFGFKKKSSKSAVAKDTVKKETAYDKLFKEKHETVNGFITLHKIKGKVFFELPISVLNKQMLLGSTVTRISDNANAVVGSKPTTPLHVMFTKTDKNVQLRELNTDYVSSNSNIDKALEASKMGAIMCNQTIAAYNNDSTAVVCDMTDFFVSDNKRLTPFDPYGAYSQYKRSESFKKDLSYLDGVKAFDDNISVKSSLSYNYTLSNPISGMAVLKDQPLTVEMTRSFVLLPEEHYRPRMADYRIGVFFTERMKLGDGSATTAPIFYANRWQLLPSDSAAYLRGEKVEPIKPIVFYIDNNFPDKWKPYIKEGVEQWQEMFETIGFKNAIVAKEFPTDDPTFDPDNIKYSCVRYAPINIQNAMGPSWVDPRSGEILNASVYVYHDVMKLINNWLFVQTAPADKDARKAQVPEHIVNDAFRYVISHEIGHCLGFMHNMSASSAIPVDSLRSPSYTQTNGTTTSIMDYARFNYVAQPGDKERGVKLTPPRFGIYDQYLISWTYKPVLDVQTLEQEAPITEGWITEAIKNPVYRYGKQQVYGVKDPRSQVEDLGDDAIKASEYGFKNLKYVMANLNNWITEGDDDFEIRTELLTTIVNQAAMYMFHVYYNVGGLYINQVKNCDAIPGFENMSDQKQIAALKYLFKIYNDLEWMDNKDLMNKLSIMGSPKSALQGFLGEMILSSPFRVSSHADVTKKTLSFIQSSDMVFDYVWNPTRPNKGQKDLQNMYVALMMSAGGFPVLGGGASSFAISGDAPINKSLIGFIDQAAMPTDEYRAAEVFTYSPVSGFEWGTRAIFHKGQATVADVYGYLTRVKNLLSSRVASAPAELKGHYMLLIKRIEAGTK